MSDGRCTKITRSATKAAFVVAPISLASFAEPMPTKDRVIQGYRVRSFAGRSPSQDAMTFYAPLRTPELVLELAELAEKEITPETVLEWAQVYGLMGFLDEDTVTVDEGFAKFKSERMGRRDSVRSFAQAAGEIRGCLRLYEAITADEDVEMGDLQSVANLLPRKAFAPFGPMEKHVDRERPWLFRVLARMIQMRLDQYCYPQFVAHTRRRGHGKVLARVGI